MNILVAPYSHVYYKTHLLGLVSRNLALACNFSVILRMQGEGIIVLQLTLPSSLLSAENIGKLDLSDNSATEVHPHFNRLEEL